jgi:hypothetical protein
MISSNDRQMAGPKIELKRVTTSLTSYHEIIVAHIGDDHRFVSRLITKVGGRSIIVYTFLKRLDSGRDRSLKLR